MERTKQYLEEIKNNIGYVASNYGWYGIVEIVAKKDPSIIVTKINSFDGYLNSSQIDIFYYIKDAQYRYCAELSYQTDIDDFCTETHIFTKNPSRQDVLTARLLSKMTLKLKSSKFDPIKRCWECGRGFHWLDNSSKSFEEKYRQSFEDNYCGC